MSARKQIECPFCNPSILESVFFENSNYLVIYNIAPVLPGHSLIIPKKHVVSLLELDRVEMTDFFETARISLKILLKAFNTDAFDWSIQEKPEAGQTIEHLHLHIVPRLKGDLKQPGDWYPLITKNDETIIDSLNRNRLKKHEMNQIITRLKNISQNL